MKQEIGIKHILELIFAFAMMAFIVWIVITMTEVMVGGKRSESNYRGGIQPCPLGCDCNRKDVLCFNEPAARN